MKDRNIAQLIRESVKPNPSTVEARERTMPLVPSLYPGEPYDLNARKGTWRVFQRQDFPVVPFQEQPPKSESDNLPTDSGPECCAVYLQEGRPKTFVVGRTGERPLIERTLAVLSAKILEQRPLISRPARSLNAENGLAFGLRIGIITMFFVGIFAALDLILLPRFGSDVARGLSIAFSTDIVIENYRSLVGSFLENVFGPAIYPVITSMYSLAVLIILPILIIGVVFEFSGKKADKRRIREMPREALAFYYGKEAWAELLRQQGRLKDEQARRVLFEKCRALGMEVSRPQFLDLYAEMKRLLQDFPTEARDPQA